MNVPTTLGTLVRKLRISLLCSFESLSTCTTPTKIRTRKTMYTRVRPSRLAHPIASKTNSPFHHDRKFFPSWQEPVFQVSLLDLSQMNRPASIFTHRSAFIRHTLSAAYAGLMATTLLTAAPDPASSPAAIPSALPYITPNSAEETAASPANTDYRIVPNDQIKFHITGE